MKIKQMDQINLLEAVRDFTDTGKPIAMFTYPNCGWDLVQQGLATEDKKITIAGRAALWLLGKEPDPTNSKAVVEFNLKMEKKETT